MHEPSFPAPAPPRRSPQLTASRLASRVAVTLLTSPEHGSLRWPSAAAAFGLPDLEGDVAEPALPALPGVEGLCTQP